MSTQLEQKLPIVIVCLICAIIGSACSDTGNEPVDPGKTALCDSLGDPLYVDSVVVLQRPHCSNRYMVFNTKEFALFYTNSLIVYSLTKHEIVRVFDPGLFDVKGDSMLAVEDGWVSIYNMASGDLTRIVSGFHRPTFSIDTGYIHVRDAVATYKLDISTHQICDTIPSMHARELRSDEYLYYNSGMVLYRAGEDSETLLPISGLPVVSDVVSMDHYDVDELGEKIVIDLWGKDVPGRRALYEVDLSAQAATVIAGVTDGLYTPRYGENGSVYVVRTCQPLRESYVLEIDKQRMREILVFKARMGADGSVDYFEP